MQSSRRVFLQGAALAAMAKLNAQAPAPQDETRCARIGAAKLAFDSEFADQIEERGNALKALWAGLEKEAVLLDRADQAAGHVRGFEERNVGAESFEAVGAREAGNAAAENGDGRFGGRVHGYKVFEKSGRWSICCSRR